MLLHICIRVNIVPFDVPRWSLALLLLCLLLLCFFFALFTFRRHRKKDSADTAVDSATPTRDAPGMNGTLFLNPSFNTRQDSVSYPKVVLRYLCSYSTNSVLSAQHIQVQNEVYEQLNPSDARRPSINNPTYEAPTITGILCWKN